MTFRRVLGLVIVFLFIGTLFAFAQFKPTKKITIDVLSTGPPQMAPVQDVVTPVIRAKTLVTANLVPHPAIEGASSGMLVQALIAANNLPEIIAQHYIPPQFESQKILHDQGLLWNLDEATLRKYMPTFAKRMDQWGDMKTYIAQNQSIDGTSYLLGHNFDVKVLNDKFKAAYGKSRVYFLNALSADNYLLGFRDDILKQIYPTARSHAEQGKWFVSTWNPNTPLTPSPYADIPIKNNEDLYQYLKKAKAIIDSKNLKDGAGRDKMIAAQINSNQAPQSIAYSGPTFFGTVWIEPQMYRGAGKSTYNWSAPSFKAALQWYNKLFNEGLLDPELFIKPDVQLAEEYTRGRFAVYSNWSNFAPARQFAADNKLPYSYRAWAFTPVNLKTAEYDQTNVPVTYFNHFAEIMVTKTVSAADLPQVLNWLDYHYSEEYDVLTAWGPSTFYTGTGPARRFKPEYKSLEDFQAYGVVGKPGAKDGYYYGITAYSAVAIDAKAQNYEHVNLAQFFSAWPDAPQYAYPVKKDPTADYDALIRVYTRAADTGPRTNYYPQIGWSFSDLNSLPYTAKLLYQWFGAPAVSDAITAVVRGKPADFDKNWNDVYLKYFRDEQYDKMDAEYNAKWSEIWNANIKPYWK